MQHYQKLGGSIRLPCTPHWSLNIEESQTDPLYVRQLKEFKILEGKDCNEKPGLESLSQVC